MILDVSNIVGNPKSTCFASVWRIRWSMAREYFPVFDITGATSAG